MSSTGRSSLAVVLMLGAWTLACGPGGREYRLKGQVVAVDPGRQELTVQHEAIDGYMAAMTMPFKVRDARLMEGRTLGELIEATLVVAGHDAFLSRIERTGYVPLDPAKPPDAARSGFELLKTGDTLPDIQFTDHLGRPVKTSELRGRAVALTFIYTRCPVPTFCPAMDRQFAAIQRAVNADDRLRGGIQLLSISFDPANDTPAVLNAHAERLGADPGVWRFVTGDRDEVDRFAARFGVTLVRPDQPGGDITHNLRTAVADPAGRLIAVYTGFDWTPADIIRDLARAAASG